MGGNGGEGQPVVESVHGIVEVFDCGLAFVFKAFPPLQVEGMVPVLLHRNSLLDSAEI